MTPEMEELARQIGNNENWQPILGSAFYTSTQRFRQIAETDHYCCIIADVPVQKYRDLHDRAKEPLGASIATPLFDSMKNTPGGWWPDLDDHITVLGLLDWMPRANLRWTREGYVCWAGLIEWAMRDSDVPEPAYPSRAEAIAWAWLRANKKEEADE